MRNRIGLYLDILNGETLITVDDIHCRQQIKLLPYAAQSSVCQPDRGTKSSCKSRHAINMVAVFVSNDDSIDHPGFQAEL